MKNFPSEVLLQHGAIRVQHQKYYLYATSEQDYCNNRTKLLEYEMQDQKKETNAKKILLVATSEQGYCNNRTKRNARSNIKKD
jgi:hypothetical protein